MRVYGEEPRMSYQSRGPGLCAASIAMILSLFVRVLVAEIARVKRMTREQHRVCFCEE